MEYVAIAGGVAVFVWRLYTYFSESGSGQKNNLLGEKVSALAAQGGFEVAGVGSAQADHLVVGEIEGTLELSQVGGVQVVGVKRRRETRTRTLRGLSCCGSRLTLHSDDE